MNSQEQHEGCEWIDKLVKRVMIELAKLKITDEKHLLETAIKLFKSIANEMHNEELLKVVRGSYLDNGMQIMNEYYKEGIGLVGILAKMKSSLIELGNKNPLLKNEIKKMIEGVDQESAELLK